MKAQKWFMALSVVPNMVIQIQGGKCTCSRSGDPFGERIRGGVSGTRKGGGGVTGVQGYEDIGNGV